jgi:hypothetical protein
MVAFHKLETPMLIAPHIRATGDEYLSPPKNPKIKTTLHDVPEFEGDQDIKLSEGHSIVYFRVLDERTVEVLGQYTLDRFSVNNNTAHWDFKSDKGAIAHGTFQSINLADRLSAKLVMPVVLLQSRSGFRTAFRFRTDRDCRVMAWNRFREMVADEG